MNPEQPDTQLVEAYHQLLTDCIRRLDHPSKVSLMPTLDAATGVPVHNSVLACLGLLARTADPESAEAIFAALRLLYSLPDLTNIQGCMLLELASQTDEIATAEQCDCLLDIFPDGMTWTMLNEHAIHWEVDGWCVHRTEAHWQKVTTLAEAAELAAKFRRERFHN